MNSIIIQLEEFDQCILWFLSTPMKECKTFLSWYSTIGWPTSKIWNNVANYIFFLSISKWLFLLICHKTIEWAWVENKAWFFLCPQAFLSYESPFLIFNFKKSFFVFLNLIHMGTSWQGFLSIVMHTLHMALWRMPLVARTPSTQGSFVTHSI